MATCDITTQLRNLQEGMWPTTEQFDGYVMTIARANEIALIGREAAAEIERLRAQLAMAGTVAPPVIP